MEQYTIFCTPEQTRKALELGAPIYMTFAPGDYIEPILAVKDENSKEKTYLCPTAEQMIGFLGTEGIFVDVHKAYCFPVWHWEVCTDDEHIDSSFEGYGTRKEAIIAALDVALDYLIKNKK